MSMDYRAIDREAYYLVAEHYSAAQRKAEDPTTETRLELVTLEARLLQYVKIGMMAEMMVEQMPKGTKQ